MRNVFPHAAIVGLFMLIAMYSSSQTPSGFLDSATYARIEWRCGVAHWTADGVFSCDFKGTYYPERIFDTTVKKWFIKIVNGDSLFYYKTDAVGLYIWNGRPKNQEYGYEWKTGGGSVTLPDKYNGSDTLRSKYQIWKP